MTARIQVIKSMWTDALAVCRKRPCFLAIIGVSMTVTILVASMVYHSSDGFNVVYMDKQGNALLPRTPFIISQLPSSSSSSSSSLISSSSSISSKGQDTKHQVLLITYGRSGSTFTSALINFPKDVFFIFEPLYVLQKKPEEHQNTTKLPDVEWMNGNETESVAIINAFLTCNFPLEYIYALDNIQHKNSDATRDLNKCLMAQQKGTSHLSCFLEFVKSCQEHNVAFVKTIRFKVAWSEWFLKTNPNFKLLFLIRDPRATLHSQSKTFHNFPWTPQRLDGIAKHHCSLIQEDLKALQYLKEKYPNRVLGIRYEHGALDPFGYTKEIYGFLGLNYNANIQKFIDSLTNHTAKDKRTRFAYEIVRANSTKTMDKWRYTAGYKNIKVIDDMCGYLYPQLGYKTVTSQEDLESHRPLVEHPLKSDIFTH